MSALPFITVAVPAYQRTQFIREAVQSAVSQDYGDFDILVSDDSSHDGIEKIVASFASDRIRYVRNSPPLGLMPKLNDFLVRCKGDWIVILCDDDRFEPGFLRAVGEKIAAHPAATSARCRYRLMDENGREVGADAPIPEVLGPFEFLSRIFLPPGEFLTLNITGVLFPKKLLRQAGGFASFYKGLHADRLAWATLGALGETLSDPRPLCSLRIHEQSESGTTHDDYRASLDATRATEQAIGAILREAASRASDEKDRKWLDLAQRRADAYVARCLRSGLDKSLRGALLRPGAGTAAVETILQTARENGVPKIQSASAYRLLARLPFSIRKPLLGVLTRFKR